MRPIVVRIIMKSTNTSKRTPPGISGTSGSALRPGRSWDDVVAGGKESRRRLIEHNKHDLYGMRPVVRLAVGLDDIQEWICSSGASIDLPTRFATAAVALLNGNEHA